MKNLDSEKLADRRAKARERERIRRLDPQYNAKQREKYREDADYKSAKLKRSKDAYSDPLKKDNIIAKRKTVEFREKENSIRKEKYANDPDLRRKILAENARKRREKRLRKQADYFLKKDADNKFDLPQE